MKKAKSYGSAFFWGAVERNLLFHIHTDILRVGIEEVYAFRKPCR